jgi:hypothetical protein
MARCGTCNRELPPSGVCAVCSGAGSEPTVILAPQSDRSSSAETVVGVPHSSGSRTAASHTSGHTSGSAVSAASSSQQMAPGTVLAARYRIVAPIGRGGMGQVYRAEDLKLGETVALKFLPASLAQDQAWLGRFFMEVRTAREVTHANVCRVHDVVETTGADGHPLYFLTMEYVDGENLADLVKRFGRLPTEKGMEIAGQITAALAAAHEKGVLHRDIKPANVMIDGRGQAKLADFGLATGREGAQAAEIAGTPGYIAPEILRGAAYTGRSDLYALGLVLYELLTGRRAIKDGKAVTGSVRQYAPEVSLEAEKAVLRCMDADPARRPANATEVLAAFPAKNAMEAALARGETPSPEMVADSADEQPMQLWKAWSLVGATVLILLVTWVVGGWGGYWAVKPAQLSPDEMRGRAQQYLRDFGYSTQGTVQRVAVRGNYDVLDWYSAHATPLQKRNFRNSPQGSAQVTYEQAAQENLLPADGLGEDDQGEVVPRPVLDLGQAAQVTVDSDGNLLALAANANNNGGGVNWPGVLKATGLDQKSIATVNADFKPPFATDELHAWTGYYPGHPEIPMQVRAAAWHGALNYVQVSGPWGREQVSLLPTMGDIAFPAFKGMALLIGFLLAVYNLRRKRGDTKSATRLALFLLLVDIPLFLLGVQHASHHLADYLAAFGQFFAQGLLSAAFLWMVYVAVEPLTRKKIPELLVASALILQDRWRSPRVGREILIGTVVGVVAEFGYQAGHALQWRFLPGASLSITALGYYRGLGSFLEGIFFQIQFSMLEVAGTAVLFTLVLVLLRNRGVAFVVAVLATLAQSDTRGAFSWAILITLIFGGLQGWLILRVGLVATVTFSFIASTADVSTWPHAWSNWMVPEMFWAVATILAVAGFGFWLAIGEQKPFGALKLEE